MSPSGRSPSEFRTVPCELPPTAVAEGETESFLLFNDGDLRVAVARTQRLDLLRGGSDIDRSMIATIVSELGSNILKYAGRGSTRLERLERRDGVDIDIWAEDAGPGIADINLALQEHYSTGGTLGLGLSGVQRMADEFWIRSAAGTGTTVFARKRIRGRAVRPKPSSGPPALPPIVLAAPASLRWDANASVRPFPGHARSGDAALIIECDGGVLLAIIDATGHGPAAQRACEQAQELLQRQASRDLARLMNVLHTALLGDVGAAVGLLFIDPAASRFSYLGVGNTRAARLGVRPWRGVSRDGLLGSRLPTPFAQDERLEPGDVLMLWTDGIPEFEGARLAESISFRGAADITRRVMSALAKPHDDAGCLVFKWPA